MDIHLIAIIGLGVVFAVVLAIQFVFIKKMSETIASVDRRCVVMAKTQASKDQFISLEDGLARVASARDSLQSSVENSVKGVLEVFSSSEASLKLMDDSLSGIRDYLSVKGQESQRLQEGHDYAVLKNFCKQVIRCIHHIQNVDMDSNSKVVEALRGIHLDLVDLLDRNGVVEFIPEIGSSFDSVRSFAEVSPVKEITKDAAKVGKIAEVVRSGFRYVYNNDQVRSIVPAQVKLYSKGN